MVIPRREKGGLSSFSGEVPDAEAGSSAAKKPLQEKIP